MTNTINSRYIAYNENGDVIACNSKSWVNLAQGVCESYPNNAFTIRDRDGVEVYNYWPVPLEQEMFHVKHSTRTGK